MSIDVIELNEIFSSQGLAILRMLGLPDDDPCVNPNGGAIGLCQPLGMSGVRLVTTTNTLCISVGQGDYLDH
jgi:acetyl-CoA C-acetyltransferase